MMTYAEGMIRRDAAGRWCLEDVHRAAGGGADCRPELWRATPEAKALAAGGEGGDAAGEFVPRAAALAYALWLGPDVYLRLAEEASAVDPAREFRALFAVARLIGCDRNAAAISANQAVRRLCGMDVLDLLGQARRPAADQEGLYFNPTELGARLGVSGRRLNRILAELGLQERLGERWVPTAAAQGLCRIFDTGKRRSDGTPVQQPRWAGCVAELAAARLAEADV